MKKCNRSITSLVLTIIYLVIVFSPVAPLAMQSKHVAHAVTGECSGDCKIDGCSLERSAAHTCCCAQKKLSVRNTLSTDFSDTHPTEAPKKGGSCCAAKSPETHEDDAASSPASDSSPQEKRTGISSKPCGSGKLFALLNIETTQHLPFFFTETDPSPTQSLLTVLTPDRLVSRYADPPDPPPII